MKKLVKILSVVIICVSFSLVNNAQVLAKRTSSRPRIDGKLSDSCWQKAVAYNKFYKAGGNGKAAQSKTSIKILFNDSSLYIGIRCEEPKTSEMKTDTRPRDGGIYQLDSVEVMLDPACSNERYYHFMVSARGDVYDSFVEQGGGIHTARWNGRWKAKTFIGKGFWSCEMKIPFYNFAEVDSIAGNWGINICRNRRPNVREDSSILAKGSYHSVTEFLKLKGIDIDFKRFQLSVNKPEAIVKPGQDGKLEIALKSQLKNGGIKSKTYTADAWIVSPKKKVKTFAPVTCRLKPAESKIISLPSVDFKDQGEYKIVFRILDENQRPVAFREARANIRHTPVRIKLLTPWYRNCIFESQKIKNVEFKIFTEMSKSALNDKCMEISIQNKDKKVWSKKITNIKKIQDIKVPNSKIPYGRYVIKAALIGKNGKAIPFGIAEYPLWKLTHKKSEVWLGRDGNFYINGKVFYFHSGWFARLSDNKPEHTLIMSMNSDSVPANKKWLSSNLIFRCRRRIPDYIKTLQGKYFDEKSRAIVREIVKKDRDYENLFAYFLADEPSSMSINPEALRQVYEVIKETDPWHPVVISDSPRNQYIFCGDIQGHHPYPSIFGSKKRNDCTPIWKAYSNGLKKQNNKYHKTAFVFMRMGFNKYDYGLGPKDSRIASYIEFRDQNLMAFACGVKGLIPFDRTVNGYPECYIGFPYLFKEESWLGKAVVAPDSKVKVSASNENIHMISKDVNGNLVIIASNVSNKPGKVTFSLSGLPATVKYLNVVSEGRKVPVVNGKFTDNFEVCEGHVYTSGAMPELKPVSEIEAEIERAWAKRRKKGNILFQRYINKSVNISASSATNKYHQDPASAFWHLCDGLILKDLSESSYGFLQWTSKKGALPAWLELKLKKAAMIGRIEIYPLEKSLKEFQVKVFSDGKWNKIYETSNCDSSHVVCKFSPRKVEKIRIDISKTNGSKAMISEIEAYNK